MAIIPLEQACLASIASTVMLAVSESCNLFYSLVLLLRCACISFFSASDDSFRRVREFVRAERRGGTPAEIRSDKSPPAMQKA